MVETRGGCDRIGQCQNASCLDGGAVRGGLRTANLECIGATVASWERCGEYLEKMVILAELLWSGAPYPKGRMPFGYDSGGPIVVHNRRR